MSDKELNSVIDRAEDEYQKLKDKVMEQGLEIERLNNIINKGIEAINVYQNEKTLSVGYQDLKRIRGILKGNEFDLKMFEEYLEELKEENEFLRLSNPEMNIEHFRYVKENKRKIDNLRLVNKRLNNIINELENRDDVLEEFEDWLESQKTRNSEWDNFVMVDCRLGIPISYLLNKLQELKGVDKE